MAAKEYYVITWELQNDILGHSEAIVKNSKNYRSDENHKITHHIILQSYNLTILQSCNI